MAEVIRDLKTRLQRIQAVITYWQQKEMEVRKEMKKARRIATLSKAINAKLAERD